MTTVLSNREDQEGNTEFIFRQIANEPLTIQGLIYVDSSANQSIDNNSLQLIFRRDNFST